MQREVNQSSYLHFIISLVSCYISLVGGLTSAHRVICSGASDAQIGRLYPMGARVGEKWTQFYTLAVCVKIIGIRSLVAVPYISIGGGGQLSQPVL